MDEKAYEQIAHRARPEIESIVRRFFASLQMEEEIDDVVQEVLILLWRYRDRLDKVEKLEAWVNRVSRNQCVTRYRQLKRQENVSINGRDFIASDSASGTVDDAERRQMTKLLFDQLPKATRRILYLRNVEGMTLDDIATICNRPKTSIKSSISAARKQIIDQLKRQR